MMRLAKHSDLAKIVAISQSVQIGEKADTAGFLMSAYSDAEYKKFLSTTKNVTFLVDTDSSGEVCAFLLAYNQTYANSHNNSATAQIIQRTLGSNARYWIIKQIATAPTHQGLGHASRLYRKFIANLEFSHIFTTIVSDPPNPASEAFHRKHGFTSFFDTHSVSNDGNHSYKSQVWYMSAPTAIRDNTESNSALLMENLHMAITLYLHEDNLNWTKIRFLITILFALIVAAWAVIQIPEWGAKDSRESYINVVLSAMIIANGYVILYAIGRKIKSGMTFFASHKECVRLLESKLASMEPGFVTPVLKVPQVADTIKIMKSLPTLSLLAWTVMSGLLISRIVSWLAG